MKVLHFIPAWGLGGAERIIDEIIRNCTRDIESSILTFKVHDPHLSNENVMCISGTSLIKYARFLYFIRKHKPTIVHGHMTPVIPFLVILHFFNRNIKLVYTVHGEYKKPGSVILRLLDCIFYTKLKIRIVSVSDFSFNSIKKHWDIPHLVILNGVSLIKITASLKLVEEIESFKKSQWTRIFITIARIVPVKNLELMVAAFKQLSEKHDIVLVIIGNDPSAEQTEMAKLRYIASDNIVFHTPDSDARDYLTFADAFCMSSVSEALPLSLLEAISIGVPVLSTNAGGIPEVIINGFNGFLSKDLSIDGYTKLITDFLILSPQEVAALKQNAIKHYNELFTAVKMCSKYLNLYCDQI